MATSVAQALDGATERLRAAGVEAARGDARLLLAHALGVGPEAIIGYPERPLSRDEGARFGRMTARRAAREPVSRILGRREFWSLEMKITPATLDPRPDSECLVGAVLARIAEPSAAIRILDLGTGCGCLLLALLSELPRARGLGIDMDLEALAAARDNARGLGLSARAAFAKSDWGRDLIGSWQLIVSNPPYIKDSAIADLTPEVARYDPPRALSGGEDGLEAYRQLAPQISRLLAADGMAALEVGRGQADAVERLLGEAGLGTLDRTRDLAGIERCLVVTLGGQ